ncbi:phosphotransferase family protein [Streptomyces profundus]|uniref:phosphotransferase family protein n=1 Tax=Streptomyces profundus TaxID=2867410 RepID=UPI001D16ADF9|nr:aminoglycoside phosphotransferase family protein [Streptomyces sp. MA3_2.13]UED85348.1 aminoglycoside phosphotransferase family protein [Streptomyces sp. MA3_2.13]
MKRPEQPEPGERSDAAEPLDRGALLTVARRHGVAPDDVRLAAFQGAAGWIYLLGDHLVLKVARPGAGLVADLRKEALVVPFAVRQGVRTPEMVACGEIEGPARLPYLLLRRASGSVVGANGGDPGDPGEVACQELGRELALLHGARVPPAVRDGLPVDRPVDPRPGIDRLAGLGYLSSSLADWLGAWLARLAEEAPASPEMVLIHGDIAANNLLLDDEGSLTALLDWGDAAWADPAMEFAKVPPRLLPAVLTGYLGGPEAVAEAGRSWVARALWHHLSWAVPRAMGQPDPVAKHWSAQPANRLLELLRCYAEELPSPWAGWMRSQRLP